MTRPLTKSLFVKGYQCPKLLWWHVHEPDAKELEPGVVQRDLFDQGIQVEHRAREEWPQGTLVADRNPETTRAAMASGATVLFGACFEIAGALCVADVLERNADGWRLIEVKSTTEVKKYHAPDVAFQVYVARQAGVIITRAELMHLNKEYRYPGGEAPLFVRADVTETIEPFLAEVAERIATQRAALDGSLPEYPVGEHCWFHNDCAFFDRCWPSDPDHIRNMWNVGPKKTIEWMAKGVHTMSALSATAKLNDKQKRQLRAQREHALIVEPGLAAAMQSAVNAKRLGFLDFETVGRALPVWDGLSPYRQTAAQFSYHERQPDGTVTHKEFLAEGPEVPGDPPDDPREPIARAMLAATAAADLVVIYTAFEGARIQELANHLPHLAEPLLALKARLWDMQPAVRENVYHADFRGSFSLKYILKPLVHDLDYSDLVIVDGMTASVEIARLLFVSGHIPPRERDAVRRQLLDYCERDTFATVRLVERLVELAGG